MPETKLLDTTEKTRTQLELEYQIFSKFLIDKLSICLAFKTNPERPENKCPPICPQWEHFDHVMDLRESLRYRVGALVWHCRQFPLHHKEHTETISELRIKGEDHHNAMIHASSIASFLFDDVVFCSASVFDYLAQLIFKLNYPNQRGQKFWSDLVKVRDHEDAKLGELIKSTHDEFVYGLSRLRGRSIHTQADTGGIELTEYFTEKGITHLFNFTMPKEAMKFIPIFDQNRSDFPIEPGACLIALRSIVSVRQILNQLANFEYKCLYARFHGQ